jgi:general secretion pathway protein D
MKTRLPLCQVLTLLAALMSAPAMVAQMQEVVRDPRPPDYVAEIASPPSALSKKLDAIVIPEVSFNNLRIDLVVQALKQISAQFDASGDSVKGVKIILVEENPKETVKIQLRNLSVHRVLDLITEQIGYQYEVRSDSVWLSTGTGINSSLVKETFPVPKSTLERISGAAPVRGPTDPGSPKPDVPFNHDISEEIQGFFQNAGVNFAQVRGSALTFDGAAITVTQTAKNLDKIRNILTRYLPVMQVSIETRFIEVNESNLAGAEFSQVGLPSSSVPQSGVASETAGPVTGAATYYLPNLQAFLVEPRQLNGLNSALAQTTGAEVLSTPSVTVLSGFPASIQVAEDWPHVTVVEPAEFTASGPEDSTARNVGVELDVSPTVEDDDYSISLDLEFKAKTLEGFIKLGGVPTGSAVATSTFLAVSPKKKVTIWDGASLVFRFSTQQSSDSQSPPRCLLVFITANIVGPGGSLKGQELNHVPRNTMFQEGPRLPLLAWNLALPFDGAIGQR